MQSSIEHLEALKRAMTVIVPVEEVTAAYRKRLQEVAKVAKIDGFRPGKIPESVLEQRYRKALLQEVASELIRLNFEKAVEASSLRVAGMFSITEMDIKKDQPFTFKATFEVYPDIDLKSLSGVTIEREVSSVSEVDFADMLTKIQKQFADYRLVERDAKIGDRVVIDFDGSINGEAFTGGTAKQHTVELGSNRMIPGFEEGIVGMHVGEMKEITVQFPEDYQAEDLKGKEATFNIMLHKIEEPILPAIDDALAEKMQVAGGVEALKTKIREGMERELKQKLQARLKEAVMDQLLAVNTLDVPESMVLAEAKNLKEMTLNRMSNEYGLKFEQMRQFNLPEELYKPQADKRVRLGLLMAEVIKKNTIQSHPEQVKERIEEIAAYYQKPEEVAQWYLSNEESLSEVEAAVLEDQVVAHLLQEATVVDKVVAYKDIIA